MTTLIGTNPDQIPVNAMLGGLAYQDPDSVSVKDLASSGTASITNLSYSGTLTGGTGVINIGSGQVYKDASGKVGLNTTNPLSLLHLNQGTSGDGLRFERSGYDVMDIELSENGLRIRNETDGRTDLLINGTGDLSLFGTGATKIQEGTTAQRPSTPAEGMIRKNSTLNMIEGYVGGEWKEVVTVPATSGVVGRFQSVSGVNLSGSGVYELNINGTVSGINKIEMTFDGVSSNGAGDIFFDIGTSTGGYSPGGASVFFSEAFNTTTSNILNSSVSSVTPSDRLRLSTANDSNSVLTGKITIDKHIQGGGAHSFVVSATVHEYRPGVGTSITSATGIKLISFLSDTLKIKLVAEGNQFDSGAVYINAYTIY